MSDANREQITGLLNSVWTSVTAEISKSRNVSVEKLNEIANGLLARTPEMAKAQKLVDIIAYEDVYHNDIRKKLDVAKDEEYNTVSIVEYTKKTVTTSKDERKDQIILSMLKAKYKAVKVMSMQLAKVPCDALCKKLEKIKCKSNCTPY
jgi:protease-4